MAPALGYDIRFHNLQSSWEQALISQHLLQDTIVIVNANISLSDELTAKRLFFWQKNKTKHQ